MSVYRINSRSTKLYGPETSGANYIRANFSRCFLCTTSDLVLKRYLLTYLGESLVDREKFFSISRHLDRPRTHESASSVWKGQKMLRNQLNFADLPLSLLFKSILISNRITHVCLLTLFYEVASSNIELCQGSQSVDGRMPGRAIPAFGMLLFSVEWTLKYKNTRLLPDFAQSFFCSFDAVPVT